ncbi:hypothetical protein ETB97_011245 [Aspergillus alliaceus]|uniref:Uncharacterized protein n=1 Tax=Petromyces alliaceus TaxID=209559 RepID=A0A8H6A4M8_PETAA|nr:hypothetical protein ETB97_011245 [Aspergillus burnettii]
MLSFLRHAERGEYGHFGFDTIDMMVALDKSNRPILTKAECTAFSPDELQAEAYKMSLRPRQEAAEVEPNRARYLIIDSASEDFHGNF